MTLNRALGELWGRTSQCKHSRLWNPWARSFKMKTNWLRNHRTYVHACSMMSWALTMMNKLLTLRYSLLMTQNSIYLRSLLYSQACSSSQVTRRTVERKVSNSYRPEQNLTSQCTSSFYLISSSFLAGMVQKQLIRFRASSSWIPNSDHPTYLYSLRSRNHIINSTLETQISTNGASPNQCQTTRLTSFSRNWVWYLEYIILNLKLK